MQVKLPDGVGGRCDASISVISSTSSQSAHVLLYGGQHKWAEETVAETTLMVLCKYKYSPLYLFNSVFSMHLSLQSHLGKGQ